MYIQCGLRLFNHFLYNCVFLSLSLSFFIGGWGGGKTNREIVSYCAFVRACARAASMPSQIRSKKRVVRLLFSLFAPPGFPFSLCVPPGFPFSL